ncbi:hypothetical protein SAMN05421659_102240 [[Clostridium] fimetarium]|uniref:Uncharacterized protein n=1 Tax=[Clostridium] fimetarium TaxID=99656 RepID=A0A1I0MXI8_9FIRM|nr:hypothetical protein SAMN05421659_102240 [[Clostridium] fimetarium]
MIKFFILGAIFGLVVIGVIESIEKVTILC